MSKRYEEAKKLVDPKKFYTVKEAIELAKETSKTKFDASIEMIVKLNLDTTKAEQQLRGNISLPHYFGKETRVLVIDDGLTKEVAKENKIKLFGGSEKIAEIKDGWMDFDIIVTTPKFMVELSKLGKILGPKGLMPNPKLGNVTTNTLKTALEFKRGKNQYKTDTYGNIHMMIAKVSSPSEKIEENYNAVMDLLLSKRPSTVKGDYVQKIYLCSSMGPSIRVKTNNNV